MVRTRVWPEKHRVDHTKKTKNVNASQSETCYYYYDVIVVVVVGAVVMSLTEQCCITVITIWKKKKSEINNAVSCVRGRKGERKGKIAPSFCFISRGSKNNNIRYDNGAAERGQTRSSVRPKTTAAVIVRARFPARRFSVLTTVADDDGEVYGIVVAVLYTS